MGILSIVARYGVNTCQNSVCKKYFSELCGMAGKKKTNEYRESEYAKDIAAIMAAGGGPFTRSMLAEELEKLYPKLYWQDLMNAVSGVIQLDRLSRKNRFKLAKPGWYDLNKS
jgi:hypothetical protein